MSDVTPKILVVDDYAHNRLVYSEWLAEVRGVQVVEAAAGQRALQFAREHEFAMFLLGLWVGRRGIAANLAAHRPLLRHWAYWGLGLGLPLNLAYALTPPGGPWWQAPVVAIVEPFASALLASAGPCCARYDGARMRQ